MVPCGDQFPFSNGFTVDPDNLIEGGAKRCDPEGESLNLLCRYAVILATQRRDVDHVIMTAY